MKRRERTRWWSALGLALVLSASLLAAACTDDDSKADGANGAATATAVAPAPSPAGLGAAAVTGGTEFAATNGLFVVRHPAGWVAEQHADGGGVAIASSQAAINAGATAPTAADLAFNVTFLPAQLFRLLDVDPDAPSQAVAQFLTPTSGADPATPEAVQLAGGRSVIELRGAGGSVDGAIFLFDAAPGVLGVVSVSVAPGGYAPARDLVLAMLDSLAFVGDVERLIEVIGPPPSTPGVFG